MKPDIQRANMLRRLVRFRRMRRMQALEILAGASGELDRLDQLNSRTQSILGEIGGSSNARDGSDLFQLLSFQRELQNFGASTEQLHEQALGRTQEARQKLEIADSQLGLTEDLESKTSRKIAQKTELKASFASTLACGLQRSPMRSVTRGSSQ